MFAVGEVVWALNPEMVAAGKDFQKGKFHLRVCRDRPWYVVINSKPNFDPNFRVSHNQCPPLKNDFSFISAYAIFHISDRDMGRRKAKSTDCVLDKDVLRELADFFNDCGNLTDEQREPIVDSLVDAAL